ncbi:MAG TPA: hypothetical protein VM925_35500 [Labilithrix sp.]|nr:hypothetical protein [Labilithrix sp.]
MGLLTVGVMFAGCGAHGEVSQGNDEVANPRSSSPKASTGEERSPASSPAPGRVGDEHAPSAVGDAKELGSSHVPGVDADPSKVRVCESVRLVEKFEVSTSTHHKLMGNTPLSPISEHGTVPCMHTEDFTIAECEFHADPRSSEAFTAGGRRGSSGNWVIGGDGKRYAQLGQPIGLDGLPEGEYVVARRSPTSGSRVPCVAPEANDSAGTPAGVELAGACVIESLTATTNATGLPLISYASLEVCTSSSPHPDGAAFVRIASNGAYCYRHAGAALNDINGTEIDANGVYIAGPDHCHVVWSNGYEVPGAKRPSTKTLPAPGSVVTTTPVAWRPVTSVTVANP